MKIISYATASKRGFEKQMSEVEWRQHMKELHQLKVPFTPCVLIKGLPGSKKPKWKELNEYNKILKKGGANGKS